MFVVVMSGLVLPRPGVAQLVTDPKAIPRTGNPLVVFLNGQETDCSIATFQHSFGIADQVLQANGRASFYFNNCNYSGSPSIEKLGVAFGTVLAGLTYADGQPVGTVDIVGYSMGGLIVRSYLSGKQEAQATFSPPATIPIRKALFVATPNFGTPVAGPLSGFGVQYDELSSGSHFLMDLNTWNQSHDDLRGVDALAMIGNGGTGITSMVGFDDGLVPLSSGSLRFYQPGRTRILPRCHQPSGRLLTQFGFCPTNSKGIALVEAASDDNARIMVSFLNGTTDWQSIGTAAEQDKFLPVGGGLLVRARTPADATVDPASIVATPSTGPSKVLNMSNSEIGYTDYIAAGPVTLTVNAGATFSRTVNLLAGGSQPFIVKSGPLMDGVAPSAAAIFPLVLAPRMIISIYGSGLAQSNAQATGLPLQTILSDATVRLNGNPIGLLYVSSQQINAVLPDNISGLAQLTVQNSAGAQSIHLWIEPAFPAVFTVGQSGSGAAAALNASNNVVVSSSNPLHAGDYLELFLTGLGSTTRQNGLDVANQQPTVTIGGVNCPVTFAGAAPGFVGLDQINCQVPAGLGSQANAAVVVQSGGRSSPVTTVVVQ